MTCFHLIGIALSVETVNLYGLLELSDLANQRMYETIQVSPCELWIEEL